MELAVGAAQAPSGHYWNLANAYVYNQLQNLCFQHGLKAVSTGDILGNILRILPAVMIKYGTTLDTTKNDMLAITEDDPFQAIEGLVEYFYAVVSNDIIGNQVLPAEWLYHTLCRFLHTADPDQTFLDWREIDTIRQITFGTCTLGKNWKFQHVYDSLAEQQDTINDRACQRDLEGFFKAINPADVTLEQMLTLINKPFFKAVTPKLKQLIESYVHYLLIRKQSPAMKQIPKNDITKQCIAQAQLNVIVKMFGETGFAAMLKDDVVKSVGSLALVPAFILYTQRGNTEIQRRYPEGHFRDASIYASHFWNLRFEDPLEHNPYHKQQITRPDMKTDWKMADQTAIFWNDNEFYLCRVGGAGSSPGYFNVIDSQEASFDMHPTQMYTIQQYRQLRQEIWKGDFPCGTFVQFNDRTKGQVVSATNPDILTVRSEDGRRFEKHKDSLKKIAAFRMDVIACSLQLQDSVQFESSNGGTLYGLISSIFDDKYGNLLAYEVFADKKYYVRLDAELAKCGRRKVAKKVRAPSAAPSANWRVAAANRRRARGEAPASAQAASVASSEAASVASSPAPSVASGKPAGRSATTAQYEVGEEVQTTILGQSRRGTIHEILYVVRWKDDGGNEHECLRRQDQVHKP